MILYCATQDEAIVRACLEVTPAKPEVRPVDWMPPGTIKLMELDAQEMEDRALLQIMKPFDE